MNPKRGDIYYIRDAGNTRGSEQSGDRPGVIVSNRKCNMHSNVVEVVYLTRQAKKEMTTHVKVVADYPSIALCEQIHSVSKMRIEKYMGHVTREEQENIDKALMVSIGLKKGEQMNELIKIGNQGIEIKEFGNQRVVTFNDIDLVHERPKDTARRNFNSNRKRFIEGEDYFVRNSSEAKKRVWCNCSEWINNFDGARLSHVSKIVHG